MLFEVLTIPPFNRQLKRIIKKYPDFKAYSSTLNNTQMTINLEVQDHKVELITKLLEHLSFVKIKESQVSEDQFQQRSVGVVQPRSSNQYPACS